MYNYVINLSLTINLLLNNTCYLIITLQFLKRKFKNQNLLYVNNVMSKNICIVDSTKSSLLKYIYVTSWTKFRRHCITSVLRYFGPSRTWFSSSFLLLLVWWTICRIHTQLKKSYCIRPTVGPIYCIRRSDDQPKKVGCTTLVIGLMYTFCRLDAKLLLVGSQIMKVVCTTFVGWMTHS